MPLAQRLQIALVGEQLPVSLVRHDVVDDRRRSPMPRIRCGIFTRTLSTERLAQKLARPQVIGPDRQGVPCVILGARLALRPRPMFLAPAVACQLSASCVIAGSQWPARHGLSPPSSGQALKDKSRNQRHAVHSHVIGSGFQSTDPLEYQSCVRFCSLGSRPGSLMLLHPAGSS